MEEWAELSTSSWLVAHGNMHGDEPKIRPLYLGMIQALDTSQHFFMLIISQIAAPINAFPFGSIRFRPASLCTGHFLHGSQRTEAVPPHRHAIQPFPSEVLGFVCFFFLEPHWGDYRRIS